jgi:hypothetical protein
LIKRKYRESTCATGRAFITASTVVVASRGGNVSRVVLCLDPRLIFPRAIYPGWCHQHPYRIAWFPRHARSAFDNQAIHAIHAGTTRHSQEAYGFRGAKTYCEVYQEKGASSLPILLEFVAFDGMRCHRFSAFSPRGIYTHSYHVSSPD